MNSEYFQLKKDDETGDYTVSYKDCTAQGRSINEAVELLIEIIIVYARTGVEVRISKQSDLFIQYSKAEKEGQEKYLDILGIPRGQTFEQRINGAIRMLLTEQNK